MGYWTDLGQRLGKQLDNIGYQAFDNGPPPETDPTPRRLSEDDINDFVAAAERRDVMTVPGARRRRRRAIPREDFLHYISNRHPIRMRKLARDLDWLRKQARKVGLTDEDVRCHL